MGDAAGQHSQALQLLALLQPALQREALLFGAFALGDVAAHPQHRIRLPIPEDDGGLGLHVRVLAALTPKSELGGDLLAPRFPQLGQDSTGA